MAALAEPIRTAVPGAFAKRILHVFPSFGIGGVPLRMVRVIEHAGLNLHHTIIALDDNFDAASRFAGHVDATLLSPPRRSGGMARDVLGGALALRRLRPDLLMTYNWGAIEWALANRLFVRAPHIHLEAGFGKEEADHQLRRRVWCRRWALGRCDRLVVPSLRLQDLARHVWKLPAEMITYLPNGVDAARFRVAAADRIHGFTRRPGELIVGTVAPLRPEKNVGRLLRVFAMLKSQVPARLMVAGDGAERQELERLAAELAIADRVVFVGQVKPETVLGVFDIFALSSDTEQMPNALLEAMAASRAVAAVDVGDVKAMVCEENQKFIVPRDDHSAFAAAIETLLRDPTLRERLGRRNYDRAVTEFSQERMFASYSEIFAAGSRGVRLA